MCLRDTQTSNSQSSSTRLPRKEPLISLIRIEQLFTQTWTNRRFVFLVVNLRLWPDHTCITRQVLETGLSFLRSSFIQHITQDRAIEQQLSGCIILGVPLYCLIVSQLSCVSFPVFNIFPPYRATLSYYFLAMGLTMNIACLGSSLAGLHLNKIFPITSL